MANVKPFSCVRPEPSLASRVAALPYDVYNRKEAKEVALKDKLSFLNIDRAESNMPDEVDTYDEAVYAKALELYNDRKADGTYIKDNEECYYIYELIMNGRSQKGIVACASIDDYINEVIKKHENTRAEKEADRIHHVDTLNAQTGPIFLAYRSNKAIAEVIVKTMKNEMLNGFTSDDGITHNVWKISDASDIATIKNAFENAGSIYIADGHHRAASAVKVGLKRRQENPGYTGEEEFNYFLSVLFDEKELMIMDYNRVLKDLKGMTKDEFFAAISDKFDITEVGTDCYAPKTKLEFGMYIENTWYKMTFKGDTSAMGPVERLDVAILQDYLLNPVLGILDPKTDNRIDFVGGIRGLKELEKRCAEDCVLAFAMYPTSITELFDVADAGLLMPPKSTWFEPKLRSGLFIHELA